jgi:hypothetical protein
MPRGVQTSVGSCPGVARRLKLRTVAASVAATVAIAAGVSGCANSAGLSLAKQACSHVDRSLAIYRQSQRDPGTQKSADQQVEAMKQLTVALPLAATAAGEASQWQALMATLSESSRLPESDLTYALGQQCAVAEGNGAQPIP